MTAVNTETPYRSGANDLLRDYHEARRREDMWRMPQILLALATPLLTLIALVFVLGGGGYSATISGALALITGTGAALLAVEVWRQHRLAIGILNRFRTEFPGDPALLMQDPL
jgi:hypothetical protein